MTRIPSNVSGDSLATLEREHVERSICPRCGEQRRAANITLSVRTYGTDRKQPLLGGKQINTHSRSFCEPCTVEVFRQMEAALLQEDE